MSPSSSVSVPLIRSFPRVSGDEPAARLIAKTATWFSPRERG